MPKASGVVKLADELVQGVTGLHRGYSLFTIWNVCLFLEASSVREARNRIWKALSSSSLAGHKQSTLGYRFIDTPCDPATRCIPVDMTIFYGNPEQGLHGFDRSVQALNRALRRAPGIMKGHIEAAGVFDGWQETIPWLEPPVSKVVRRTRAS